MSRLDKKLADKKIGTKNTLAEKSKIWRKIESAD